MQRFHKKDITISKTRSVAVNKSLVPQATDKILQTVKKIGGQKSYTTSCLLFTADWDSSPSWAFSFSVIHPRVPLWFWQRLLIFEDLPLQLHKGLNKDTH